MLINKINYDNQRIVLLQLVIHFNINQINVIRDNT